jgi:hypothetical protein
VANHIQSVDRARNFIEAYYSAETKNAYVCCNDGVYGVCEKKTSLRTKDIAKLACEAFANISRLKDMLWLLDATEKHLAKLDPMVVRVLRKIRFPCVNVVKAGVLFFPGTSSFSLTLTGVKIFVKITECSLDAILAENDLEGFCLFDEWLQKHPGEFFYRKTFEHAVAVCKYTLGRINDAKTIGELLKIPGTIYGHDQETDWRIKEFLRDNVRRKIVESSLQILELKTSEEISHVSRLIEDLQEIPLSGLQETVSALRERMKERVVLETTWEGLFRVYGAIVYQSSIRVYYESFFYEQVGKYLSHQIDKKDTLIDLLKINESVELIHETDIILKITLNGLIKKRVKEIITSQMGRIDSLDALLETIKFFESLPNPLNLVVSLCKDDMVEDVKRVCFLEIERADTWDAIQKIAEFERFPPIGFYGVLVDLRILINKKEESIYLREISQAKTLDRLQFLRRGVGFHFPADIFSRIQAAISQREKELLVVKKTFLEIKQILRKRFEGAVIEEDRVLLQKLPAGHLLSVFAENIPIAIREENIAILFGAEDFSNRSKVKSALKDLKLQVHPDKNSEEYKQVATNLWNVLAEIEYYLKRKRLV